MSFPEFGFVTKEESDEWKKLRETRSDPAKLTAMNAAFRRRITDKKRGGYYQFYGYKEFANRIFTVIDETFDIQKIYSLDKENFLEVINKAQKENKIRVNEKLLNSMKNGLLICDEIHNTYNIQETNNYGIAIHYALNYLKNSAPRAVYMSATPMTGSSTEIVDILNLLTPCSNFLRKDIFTKVNEEWKLNPGMEKLIREKTIGKISYLLDSDSDLYPERIFEGESIDKIPYLKFNICELSKFHKNTIDSHGQEKLDINSKSLVDIAFPNPENSKIGMYNSSEIIQKVKSADPQWCKEIGIGVSDTGRNLMGTFLQKETLGKYSMKYSRLIDELEKILSENNSGKIMLYHHRVSSSGVLLIGEILRMNGFIENGTMSLDSTRCAICGLRNKDHRNHKDSSSHRDQSSHMDNKDRRNHKDHRNHKFVPAKFILAHSDLDRGAMMHDINKFNAESNTYGNDIKILIGSRIIKEGINLMAVRHQIILNFPTDYPTLIQIFGRAVRKGSHNLLPPEHRNVRVKILISNTHHEINQYITKGSEYLNIQGIEKILHINAVDNFLNKDKFDNLIKGIDSLESLPYEYERYKKNINTDTYFAYGYAQEEMKILTSVVLHLFDVRPVWKFDELYETLLKNPVKGANIDFSYLKKEMLELVIHNIKLQKNRQKNLYQTETYLIMSKTLDYQSYLRPCKEFHTKRFSIVKYIQAKSSTNKWQSQVDSFIKQYYVNFKLNPLFILNFSKEFHYELIESIILEKKISDDLNFMKDLVAIYYKYNILVSVQQMIDSGVKKGKYRKSTQPVGYVMETNIKLFDNTTGQWYFMTLESYKIRRKTNENSKYVGICEPYNESKASPDSKYQSKYLTRFKIRPPVKKIREQLIKLKHDGRMANTGLACVSQVKKDLVKMYEYFIGLTKSEYVKLKNNVQMCESIKLMMMKLELSEKEKFIYLFNETPPSINM